MEGVWKANGRDESYVPLIRAPKIAVGLCCRWLIWGVISELDGLGLAGWPGVPWVSSQWRAL